MGTNSLPLRLDGQPAPADHINELHTAITNTVVPRVFVGTTSVPEAGQDLGSLVYPWGTVYATNLNINGTLIDFSSLGGDLPPNGINTGPVRGVCGQPYFIIADGITNDATVDATSSPLILTINNQAITVPADLILTGLTTAPAVTNTALVNMPGVSGDKYLGEQGTIINIDTVGANFAAKGGQLIAFKHGTAEIAFGYLQVLTGPAYRIVDVYRGFFFDSAGAPIVREGLSDNDTLTIYETGWVFVEDNGTTFEVSYLTPQWQYPEPTSPASGQYWYDMGAETWKRYNGSTWVVINRVPVGLVVLDSAACVAARTFDFLLDYNSYNDIQLEKVDDNTIGTVDLDNNISVYGNTVTSFRDYMLWRMPEDLEPPLVEANIQYYLYVTPEGQSIISDEAPYDRKDLKGFYHPYCPYRSVGKVLNNAGVFDDPVTGITATITIFDVPGVYTWVQPPGTKNARVWVIGGGGGGGGGNGVSTGGGGAGGGGGAAVVVPSVPSSVSVTVGAGGAGGALTANGVSGGASSFGTYATGNGGVRGLSTGAAGAGGTGVKTTTVGETDTGNSGIAGSGLGTGGAGGASAILSFFTQGAGGAGGAIGGGGGDGVQPGGGGGGGGQVAAAGGGDGGDGIVIVEAY